MILKKDKAVFPKEMNNSRFFDGENQQGSNVHQGIFEKTND
jgi:hypothetical protein